MSDSPYSEAVRRLFRAPAHAGALEGATALRRDDQGVSVQLFAQTDGETVSKLGFLARGCPHLMAASEAFCRDFSGREAASLSTYSAAEVMQTLAVPIQKSARIIVLEDAVHALGAMLAPR